MADFGGLTRLHGLGGSLPPITSTKKISAISDQPEAHPGEIEPQPISAFVCIIDYNGETRLITCRRYDLIGDVGYVGAICHAAKGYRQFRCDRIEGIFDATTGEAIGDGSYFSRFAVDGQRARTATWGLIPSQKATLIAGLNILAFMARSDGFWHRLESEVIESFVCAMWLRKEWAGDPPMSEIITHSERLSPDSEVFFAALRQYARSDTSTRIIRRAVGDLIAADGVIHSGELEWGAEVDAFFNNYSEEAFDEHFGVLIKAHLA